MHSTRLALIRSRFVALRGNSSLGNAETFHPVPAGRHAGTCGGVIFKRSVPVVETEDLPADFVAAPVADYVSDTVGLLSAEECATIDRETAAVSFESDYDANPTDFDPSPVVLAVIVANVAPIVPVIRGPLQIKQAEEIAEIAPIGVCDEFEFLRQRVLAMARS